MFCALRISILDPDGFSLVSLGIVQLNMRSHDLKESSFCVDTVKIRPQRDHVVPRHLTVLLAMLST